MNDPVIQICRATKTYNVFEGERVSRSQFPFQDETAAVAEALEFLGQPESFSVEYV